MIPNRKKAMAAGLAGAAVLAAWAVWTGIGDDTDATVALRPADPATVARGKTVYAAECAACHGANLEGQANWRSRRPDGLLPAPPHDPSGHTWHHPDPMLFALTKFGPASVIDDPNYRTEMPAYKDTLGDDDILAVLSYIKSTWPPQIRAQHDLINQRFANQ